MSKLKFPKMLSVHWRIKSMDKKILRREFISRRKNLSAVERDNLSKIITEKFVATEIFRKSQMIMAYLSMRDEIQLNSLIEKSFALDKKICIPVIIERGIMQATLFESFDDLDIGEFNIKTVRADLQKIIEPKKIDCVIVPGVAFDKNCNRIGMGGGFYDRFLKLTRAKKIALAFDFQVTENLPTENFDVAVDMIITERRNFYVCSREND